MESSMEIENGTMDPHLDPRKAIENGTMDPHQEKRSKPNLPQNVPYIFPEIITAMLSRLPVKSLLRFRSVSKSWLSIIDDPKFVKTHFEICSKNDEIAYHRLIFISWPHERGEIVENCHFSSVFSEFSLNPTELDYPMKHTERCLRIMGSIDGLICINVDNDTFLWNPSTRISKKLPRSGFNQSGVMLRVDGFGYDESTDDYIFVSLFRGINQHSRKMMLYSLRKDCWRRIGDFPSRGDFHGRSKFVNGAINWVTGTGFPFSRSIVSLDLAKEKYGEVAQPSYGDADGEFELSLGALGVCLSVLCDYRASHVDVWMMKEYGMRESWTKVARMPTIANVHFGFFYQWLVYISKSGEILFLSGGRIVLYDPKTNSLWHSPDIRHAEYHAAFIGASVYIESLVSPLIQ